MPGFDWFAGMDAVNIEEIGWALKGEDVLAREIERTATGRLERVADDPSKAGEVEFSEADRAVMANPERQAMDSTDAQRGVPSRRLGLCRRHPLSDPTLGLRGDGDPRPDPHLYGLTDVLVPRQHGEWLAQNVPNAEVVIDEQGGHISDPNLVTERFGWLVQPV